MIMFHRKEMLLTSVVAIVLATAANGQEKPRVFVTDSQSWDAQGSFAANHKEGAGSYAAGARPQTAEIIKTFGEPCPEVTVTRNADRADYVLTLGHEGGKGLVRKDNKWALFNKGGDATGSGSTRSLGNSVKDACSCIAKNSLDPE